MTENPLLSKLRLPGKIFQLPSRGLLYKNNELSPSVTDGEIHCHSLTAFEEITLKNSDLLFAGKALPEVLKTTIPDILQSEELYAKDVDAIMIFLRLVTYGPAYELSINHKCENGKNHSYEINLDTIINNISYLDPTTFANDYFLTLSNGQVVQLQPVKYRDVIEMLRQNENKSQLSVEDMQNNLEKSMLNIIKSVDGIEEKTLLIEWIRSLPSQYVNDLGNQIAKINTWGPNLDYTVTCKDCGEPIEIEVPINPISFF
jgi:hypothetical protein